jgi:hypothetical protein
MLFGTAPNVYYVLPLFNSALQAAIAFMLGARLRSRFTGLVAALGIVVFPYMARAGSQIRPEVFSITYVLLALYCLTKYIEKTERELPALLWMSAWLFVAYEAKITNLFFVPGIMLAMLVLKKKKSHIAILGLVLLGLFLAETAAYALLTDYKLGELEIITKHHSLAGELFIVPGFFDLFKRYSSEKLQAYWQIPFLAFLIVSGYYLLKRRANKAIIAIAIAALSFFLGMTFEVSSIKPLMPAEPFINRYFCAVLGPVFLVLAFGFEGVLRRIRRKAGALRVPESTPAIIGLLGIAAALVLGTFSLPFLPRSIRAYANSPLELRNHPLALNVRYGKAINAAYASGRPIVADGGDAGADAIATCEFFYLDARFYVNGAPPKERDISLYGRGFKVLGGVPSMREGALAVIRRPFRLADMQGDSLKALGGEAFDEPGDGRGDDSDDRSEP